MPTRLLQQNNADKNNTWIPQASINIRLKKILFFWQNEEELYVDKMHKTVWFREQLSPSIYKSLSEFDPIYHSLGQEMIQKCANSIDKRIPGKQRCMGAITSLYIYRKCNDLEKYIKWLIGNLLWCKLSGSLSKLCCYSFYKYIYIWIHNLVR